MKRVLMLMMIFLNSFVFYGKQKQLGDIVILLGAVFFHHNMKMLVILSGASAYPSHPTENMHAEEKYVKCLAQFAVQLLEKIDCP